MSFCGVRPRPGVEVYLSDERYICLRQLETVAPPAGTNRHHDERDACVVAFHPHDIEDLIAALYSARDEYLAKRETEG